MCLAFSLSIWHSFVSTANLFCSAIPFVYLFLTRGSFIAVWVRGATASSKFVLDAVFQSHAPTLRAGSSEMSISQIQTRFKGMSNH